MCLYFWAIFLPAVRMETINATVKMNRYRDSLVGSPIPICFLHPNVVFKSRNVASHPIRLL